MSLEIGNVILARAKVSVFGRIQNPGACRSRPFKMRIGIFDIDGEHLSCRTEHWRTRDSIVRSNRADHNDIFIEPEARMANERPVLRSAEDFDESKRLTQPANRGTRIVVAKDRKDRLHFS